MSRDIGMGRTRVVVRLVALPMAPRASPSTSAPPQVQRRWRGFGNQRFPDPALLGSALEWRDDVPAAVVPHPRVREAVEERSSEPDANPSRVAVQSGCEAVIGGDPVPCGSSSRRRLPRSRRRHDLATSHGPSVALCPDRATAEASTRRSSPSAITGPRARRHQVRRGIARESRSPTPWHPMRGSRQAWLRELSEVFSTLNGVRVGGGQATRHEGPGMRRSWRTRRRMSDVVPP